jgi:peptide/nickel transport system substrate-binding protein
LNTFTRRYGLKVGAMLSALAATGSLVYVKEAAAQTAIGDPVEGTGVVGGELIVGIVELPDTLDPHKTGAAVTSTVMRNCSDPLVAKDFAGNYIPGLASSWNISEDGLTWAFTIREGAMFHDGTPVTAEAVKASFDRILDPETAAVTAGGLLPPGATTELVDASTIQFNLTESFAPFLENLTSSLLGPISVAAAGELGDDFGQRPVLSGPWYVDEWRAGDRIILKRNADYAWAPEHLHQEPTGAFIETITFRSIIEEASRVAAFEAGEVHQTAIPAVDVSRLLENPDFNIINYKRKGVVFIEFNITKAPFDDVLVRRALNFAVDRQDVLDAGIEGLGEVASGFLSPTIFGYWDGINDYAPTYDPDQARALLEEAGWVDSNGDGVVEKDGVDLSFTLLNLPTDSWNRAAQVVQSYLADVGVKMEIQIMEFASLLDLASTAEHDAEMMGYTYADPDIAYLWFHSSQAGSGLNMSHVQDPDLDAKIELGRTTTDLTARAEVYADLQRDIVDRALWIPLWSDYYYVGFQPTLKNATFHPDNYAVYYDAWIEE